MNIDKSLLYKNNIYDCQNENQHDYPSYLVAYKIFLEKHKDLNFAEIWSDVNLIVPTNMKLLCLSYHFLINH